MTDPTPEKDTEVVQDGTGLDPDAERDPNTFEVDVEHPVVGKIRTKWTVKAHGEMPPNPPIEVQPAGLDPDGTAHWEVQQQRTGTVFYDDTNKDVAIGYAIRLAQEHQTEMIVKNEDGAIAWRNSYGGDSPRDPG